MVILPSIARALEASLSACSRRRHHQRLLQTASVRLGCVSQSVNGVSVCLTDRKEFNVRNSERHKILFLSFHQCMTERQAAVQARQRLADQASVPDQASAPDEASSVGDWPAPGLKWASETLKLFNIAFSETNALSITVRTSDRGRCIKSVTFPWCAMLTFSLHLN